MKFCYLLYLSNLTVNRKQPISIFFLTLSEAPIPALLVLQSYDELYVLVTFQFLKIKPTFSSLICLVGPAIEIWKAIEVFEFLKKKGDPTGFVSYEVVLGGSSVCFCWKSCTGDDSKRVYSIYPGLSFSETEKHITGILALQNELYSVKFLVQEKTEHILYNWVAFE
ncbi:Pentatricopeptide repeat-containing protein [Senna tora]|uniref:Pentatricopeptide repeat-containing protein n=1 Tax=Senna tora TaxID=362788 RepID=A0A834TLA4_9FABA|nr:Pentatricopeptide repeat-containing protein [Senna tora]